MSMPEPTLVTTPNGPGSKLAVSSQSLPAVLVRTPPCETSELFKYLLSTPPTRIRGDESDPSSPWLFNYCSIATKSIFIFWISSLPFFTHYTNPVSTYTPRHSEWNLPNYDSNPPEPPNIEPNLFPPVHLCGFLFPGTPA